MDSLFADVLKCIIEGYEHPVSIFCGELVCKAGSEIRFMAEHRAFAFCRHNYGYAHKSSLRKYEIGLDLFDYPLCLRNPFQNLEGVGQVLQREITP